MRIYNGIRVRRRTILGKACKCMILQGVTQSNAVTQIPIGTYKSIKKFIGSYRDTALHVFVRYAVDIIHEFADCVFYSVTVQNGTDR